MRLTLKRETRGRDVSESLYLGDEPIAYCCGRALTAYEALGALADRSLGISFHLEGFPSSDARRSDELRGGADA